MSGRKMKVESISAWGNYHCSSMCQACTVCGWGVIIQLGVCGGGAHQSAQLGWKWPRLGEPAEELGGKLSHFSLLVSY